MPAVNLSPVGGAAAQFFTNSGNVLTGGKLNTYLAGTTTPATTYTTSAGNVARTNPIVLDAAGRVPSGGEIWLAQNVVYKFTLTDSSDVLIATYDNISGISSLTLPIDSSNITYDPPFAGSVATNVEDKLAQVVSVQDFGAVGNGSTNDTAAFQAALNSGFSVYIPPTGSSYIVSSTLTVPANVAMYGDGYESVIQYTGTGSAIVLDPGTGNATLYDSILANFQLTNANTAAVGIRLKDVAEVLIDSVYVIGIGGGFTTAAIEFSATAATGAVFAVTIRDSILRANQVGIKFSDQNLFNAITIRGGRIQGNLGTAGIFADKTVKGFSIFGTVVEGNLNQNIVLNNGAEALTIQGCWFETNVAATNGIVLQGSGQYVGVNISGNHFANNGASPTGRALYMPGTNAIPYVGVNFNNNAIFGYGNTINPAVDFASKRFDDSDFTNNFFGAGVTTPYGSLPAATSQGCVVKSRFGQAASVTDGSTISHNLGLTPTFVLATATVADEFVSVTAKSSTTFTVAIKKSDGTPGTSQTIYWRADVT